MLHLILLFSGAIGFVPANENGQDVLYALFLKAEKPSLASDRSILPGHFPIAKVAHRFVPTPPDKGGYIFADFQDKEGEQIVWFLDNQEVSLKADKPGLTFLKAGGSPSAIIPFPCEDERGGVDVNWMPQMAELSSTNGEVRSEFLEEKLKPGILAARMRLTAGKVSAVGVRTSEKLDLYDFKALGTRKKRVNAFSRGVPNALRVEVDVPGCQVSLGIQDMTSGERGSLDIVVADCEKADSSNVVEVKIFNILLDDLIAEDKLFAQSASHPHEKVDKHFELFYDMLKDHPKQKPVPTLVSSTDDQDVILKACRDDQRKEIRAAGQAFSPNFVESAGRKDVAALTLDFIRTMTFRCPPPIFRPPKKPGKP